MKPVFDREPAPYRIGIIGQAARRTFLFQVRQNGRCLFLGKKDITWKAHLTVKQ